jgi:hypothetical protein
MKTKESVTIDCAVLAHKFDLALNAYNDALAVTHDTYNAHLGVCEAIRKAGFTKVQSGHSKAKGPGGGEFPYNVLATEIKSNYKGDGKELALEVDKAFTIMTGRFTTRQLMYLRELLNKELINCTE